MKGTWPLYGFLNSNIEAFKNTWNGYTIFLNKRKTKSIA